MKTLIFSHIKALIYQWFCITIKQKVFILTEHSHSQKTYCILSRSSSSCSRLVLPSFLRSFLLIPGCGVTGLGRRMSPLSPMSTSGSLLGACSWPVKKPPVCIPMMQWFVNTISYIHFVCHKYCICQTWSLLQGFYCYFFNSNFEILMKFQEVTFYFCTYLVIIFGTIYLMSVKCF